MFSAKAFAKINLGLEILQKREDGYHAINSLFHRISLCDELIFEPSNTIQVYCDALSAEPEQHNLVYKAAFLLQQEYRVAEGTKITIHKHIPIGAGLGGGSSDAATTLIELCRLWSIEADANTLQRIATKLGADVPFFLHSGACIASGTGTELEETNLVLPWSLLLLCPPVHISTAWAYGGIRIPNGGRRPSNIVQSLQIAFNDPQSLQTSLRNDFEDFVFSQHPSLSELKESLLSTGAFYAQMSGSGSSIFALFKDATSCNAAARQFEHLPHYCCTFQNA